MRITFAGTVEVPGRVEYVHPLHNLAVVSYDPKLLGDTPIRAARFETREVRSGEEVFAVGLRPDHKLQARATVVASVDPTYLPALQALGKIYTRRQQWAELIEMHLAEAGATADATRKAGAHGRDLALDVAPDGEGEAAHRDGIGSGGAVHREPA